MVDSRNILIKRDIIRKWINILMIVRDSLLDRKTLENILNKLIEEMKEI